MYRTLQSEECVRCQPHIIPTLALELPWGESPFPRPSWLQTHVKWAGEQTGKHSGGLVSELRAAPRHEARCHSVSPPGVPAQGPLYRGRPLESTLVAFMGSPREPLPGARDSCYRLSLPPGHPEAGSLEEREAIPPMLAGEAGWVSHSLTHSHTHVLTHSDTHTLLGTVSLKGPVV